MAVTALQVAALVVLVIAIASVIVFPPLVFVAIGLVLAYFLVPPNKPSAVANEKPLVVAGAMTRNTGAPYHQPHVIRNSARVPAEPRPPQYVGECPASDHVKVCELPDAPEHRVVSGGLVLSPEQMRAHCAGAKNVVRYDACMKTLRGLRPGVGGKILSKADVDRMNEGRRTQTRKAKLNARDDGYTVRIRADGAPPAKPQMRTGILDPLGKRRAQLRGWRKIDPFGASMRHLPPLK